MRGVLFPGLLAAPGSGVRSGALSFACPRWPPPGLLYPACRLLHWLSLLPGPRIKFIFPSGSLDAIPPRPPLQNETCQSFFQFQSQVSNCPSPSGPICPECLSPVYILRLRTGYHQWLSFKAFICSHTWLSLDTGTDAQFSAPTPHRCITVLFVLPLLKKHIWHIKNIYKVSTRDFGLLFHFPLLFL